ncbi:LysR family transcriptional regulator [Aquirhabdus sp.]|uniref:LysR family transcriptional regulator n=1 Tax=Aquirhabdus sp. TaxID=2824160 RepID=UPI00396C885F
MSNQQYSWDSYRAFVAVMETGSLSAAGRQLGTTAPTITRHIEGLEAALGVTLFSRSSTGLQATHAALALAPQIQQMVTAEAAVRRLASAEGDSERGVIRLTASEIVGTEVLPRLLASFSQHYPEIIIELSLTNRQEDLLRRDSDIAVRMVRPVQESLVAKKIGNAGVGLYAHQDYVARQGNPTSLAELGQHPIIGFDRRPSISGQTSLGVMNRELFRFRSDSDVAQLAMLRAGVGIGGCQHRIAVRTPELVPILGGQTIFTMEIWLVMHRDLRQVKRVRLLFDWLSDGLKAYVG